MDWYERALVIFIGVRLLLGGTGRALQHVRLTHTHLEVAGSYRVQTVPWERLHGARRDGATLSIAWEPDRVADVGPFDADGGSVGQEARAEQLGAVTLRQREHALAHGAAGRTIRSRPGPAWGLLAVLRGPHVLHAMGGLPRIGTGGGDVANCVTGTVRDGGDVAAHVNRLAWDGVRQGRGLESCGTRVGVLIARRSQPNGVWDTPNDEDRIRVVSLTQPV